MTRKRTSETVRSGTASLEIFKEGSGPAIVVIPSYGRDSGEDFDVFSKTVAEAGFLVLRPQPRGIGASTGLREDVSAADQSDDIAAVIDGLCGARAIVLGHAYGHFIARLLATRHPSRVRGVVLAASQTKHVPPLVAIAPFLAANRSIPEDERLAVLQGAFFAPGHDARRWLEGWYPETLAMQRASAHGVDPAEYWAGGSAPLLEIIPESDPFKPHASWLELRAEFPDRVSSSIISGASHALFPEQPGQVAEVVIRWSKRLAA